MKRMLFLALVPAIMLLVAPARAAAQTVDVCQADIASLTTLTETTVFTGDRGAFFQTKLLFLLSKAAAELAQGDVNRALVQMKGYERNLAGAADKGVIAAVDAAALQAGAGVVIACL